MDNAKNNPEESHLHIHGTSERVLYLNVPEVVPSNKVTLKFTNSLEFGHNF